MENKGKIGCSAGKTVVVDPNMFDGQNSSSNVSVPLEDLNITVQLETFKKGRTVLTSLKDGTNSTNESETVSINFFDGSNVGGEKVLTTKYTELTTVFDNGNTTETLGITNIDIDFNSSMTPMVNISFIDIRGSAIFQNEGNVKSGKNHYSTFFQLPYPTYELTIKGYYGKPVKYCLHMLKFNSKFNSQTGNFEITANFVGYTYAMLSDMLVGYLGAIAYTEKGAEYYKEIKKTRPDVLNLFELSKAIGEISKLKDKLSADSEFSKLVGNNRAKAIALDAIENRINELGVELDLLDKESVKRRFIVTKSLPKPVPNIPLAPYVPDYTQFNAVNLTNQIGGQTDPRVKIISEYADSIKKLIEEFNKTDGLKITDEVSFTNLSKITYLRLTKNLIKTGTQTELAPIIGELDYFDKIKRLRAFMTSYGVIGYIEIDIYDLEQMYAKINTLRLAIKQEIDKSEINLAEEFKTLVAKKIGFDPSIRNIVEVFTIAVEVFMKTIYQVSFEAESDIGGERNSSLGKVFGDNVYASDTSPKYRANFFPWPDYREEKSDGSGKPLGFVEKYLGSAIALDDPLKIDELKFIGDKKGGLLNAFLTKAKLEEQLAQSLINESTNWIPVSPLDTSIFVANTPYARIEGNSWQEIGGLVLMRAMTFLSYSNPNPTSFLGLTELKIEEIQGMAIAEARAVKANIKNTTAKTTLAQKGPSVYLDTLTMKTQNGEERTILKKSVSLYKYNFISGNEFPSIALPIGNEISNKSTSTSNSAFYRIWDKTKDSWIYSSTDSVFLTNYSNFMIGPLPNSYSWSVTTNVNKDLDGGTYAMIITPKQYETKNQLIPSDLNTEVSKIILSKLKEGVLSDLKSAGFNPFGGPYGIQDFVNMDWTGGGDGNELGDLPLRYVFYNEYGNGTDDFNVAFNGLAYARGVDKLPLTTKSDLYNTDTTLEVPKNWKDIGGIHRSGKTNKDKLHSKFGYNRFLFSKINGSDGGNVTLPYINNTLSWTSNLINDEAVPQSVFGSRLYYHQYDMPYRNYTQGLMFLSGLPWNKGGFDVPEIANLFKKSAGFIHVPKLWCAYIGGLMWRADTRPVVFNGTNISDGLHSSSGSGPDDPIKWSESNNQSDWLVPLYEFSATFVPTQPSRYTYIDTYQYGTFIASDPLIQLGFLFFSLPDQIKNEFKKVFFEFIEDESKWRTIAKSLEIWDGDGASFDTRIAAVYSSIQPKTQNSVDEFNIDSSVITTQFPILLSNETKGVYNLVIPAKSYIYSGVFGNTPYQFDSLFLEIAGDYTNSKNRIVQTLIDSMIEEVIIANATPYIWVHIPGAKGINEKYVEKWVDSKTLNDYLTAFKTELNNGVETITDADKKQKQAIFGSSDDDFIKLQLYRTCKNIYDKWLGGVTDKNKIFFQCGSSTISDKEMAKYLRGTNAEPSLIDSFRFLSRSFKDIGNEFYINPLPVNDYLVDNQNTSFYTVVTSLLAANDFDFIALPSFINYNDPKEVASIFETHQYVDALDEGICGPSFVCVYSGQKSKHLDFEDSEYYNDGIDFQCNEGSIGTTIPIDFSESKEDHENLVPVFSVNYSQQNQNIFKDITLDQSEFTETAESLQIVDAISNNQQANNGTLAGQNLFNVYSVRSYKASVEMMGNAMIQPMMYFQLNNIPMFHGAYMIIRVKHSITPNSMSTNFSGVRIRFPETPLITAKDMYQSLLDSLGVLTSTDGSGFSSGTLTGIQPPIIITIFDNGATNGIIDGKGYIKTLEIEIPKGIKDRVPKNDSDNPDGHKMLAEAVGPLKKMLTDWVAWMDGTDGNNGIPRTKSNDGVYAYINSAFRSYQKQVIVKAEKTKEGKPNAAAEPGTSKHGWGIAVDLQFLDFNGDVIPNDSNKAKDGFDLTNNPSLKWLLDNSYKYGFIIPESLRNGNTDEFWHFEYHGTAAACILENMPIIYTSKYEIKLVGDITSIYSANGVKNPINATTEKEDIYLGCGFINPQPSGDGTTNEVLKDVYLNPTIIAPSNEDVNFYKAILTQIGAPTSDDNLKFFYAWRQAEGAVAAFNPFNTTWEKEGSTNYNSAKVKNYVDEPQGIDATVKTLNQSYYHNLVAGLKADIGVEKLRTNKGLWTWGTGGGVARVLSGPKIEPPAITRSTVKMA